MEDWKFHKTLSGAPQGGVLSPLLSNIYLHEFDHWVEHTLIPAYTRGAKRKAHPEYQRITGRLRTMRERGETDGVKTLLQQRRRLPSVKPDDPQYRRLAYVRYADDWLLGFTGPRSEAEDIKQLIKTWLSEHLDLALSDEKTLITHATTQAAQFLGYEITVKFAEDKLDHHKRRVINGRIGLRIPANVVEAKCARYYNHGVLMHRPELLQDSDYSIVAAYQQEYRGIVQYYLPAHNIAWLDRLHWVMRISLLKTLAAKHKTTVEAMLRKYQTTTQTAEGKTLKCLEVRVERDGKRPLIARFGGISLTHQPLAIMTDLPIVNGGGRSELLQRLMADECELCGSRTNVEVHHIRKLADLNKKGRKDKPLWVMRMAGRQRKTLVVCRKCHWDIHTGKPMAQPKPD
ncbi:MAG: reverse transcriptase domain-containing protein [Chloroflexota bacterium]|nr:reverse transcriptase domain-containing protein [Chloroflexota bacterium]